MEISKWFGDVNYSLISIEGIDYVSTYRLGKKFVIMQNIETAEIFTIDGMSFEKLLCCEIESLIFYAEALGIIGKMCPCVLILPEERYL